MPPSPCMSQEMRSQSSSVGADVFSLSSHGNVEPEAARVSSALARMLRLPASFPTAEGSQAYAVRSVRGGYSLMFGAGALWIAWHWFRRGQGAGHGPGDENTVQGFNHDQ